MTISKELFLAILSMDAYNRGYDAGIDGLGDAGSNIGGAKLKDVDLPTGSQDASFFAQSYDISGVAGVEGLGDATTVVSYRGTDDPDFLNFASDVWTGWTIGTGYSEASQSMGP